MKLKILQDGVQFYASPGNLVFPDKGDIVDVTVEKTAKSLIRSKQASRAKKKPS